MRSLQDGVVREMRIPRAMRPELQTELRRVLNGHEKGDPRYSRSYEPPRQFLTLPA